MTDSLPLPPTFRSQQVSQVMAAILAGASCQVIGVGGSGKSMLLRYLCETEVRQRFLNVQAQQWLLLYLDGNRLLEPSLWGLVELILQELKTALAESAVGSSLPTNLAALHAQALRPEKRVPVGRIMESAFQAVIHDGKVKIALLCDALDDLLQHLPVNEIKSLRSWRDNHRYQLVYVLALRQPLQHIHQPFIEIEPLDELVHGHTVWLPVYTPEDGRLMLDQLSQRYHFACDGEQAEALLAASGRHPGLLRDVFQSLMDHPHQSPIDEIDDPTVLSECESIWQSLSAVEQNSLSALAGKPPFILEARDGIESLILKGLLDANHQIISPILLKFTQGKLAPKTTRLVVDRKAKLAYVDGRPITKLSTLEYALVAHLEQNRRTVMSRDALAELLYPKQKGVTSNDQIDSVVKRLRRKVEQAGGVGLLVTHKGLGYSLKDGPADEDEP